MVTPSSIPGSATRGPDTELSSEGPDDILDDPDDAPVLKKRIFDSDEEGSASLEPDFMGMYLSSPSFSFFFFFFFLVVVVVLAFYLHAYLPTCRDF